MDSVSLFYFGNNATNIITTIFNYDNRTRSTKKLTGISESKPNKNDATA